MAGRDTSEQITKAFIKIKPKGTIEELFDYAKITLHVETLARGQEEQIEKLYGIYKQAAEERETRNRMTCSYIGHDFFADAVFSEGKIRFIKVGKHGAEFCDSITSDDGKTLEPISGDIDPRLLRLPIVNIINGDAEDIIRLYDEAKESVRKIWDGGTEKNLELLMLWIFATYRFDLVGVAPYLRLRGPYGSGKTRALDIIAHLALRPLAIGPSLTEAVVFRLCEQYKPCACLNEFDEKGKGDYSSLAVQLLNSRYERGHPIPRVGGENNEKLDLFDPFGPTAFSARSLFNDTSLESRCLEILCCETERDDIPAIISPELFEASFAPLRNRLYLALRLPHFEVNMRLSNERTMPRRFRQLLTALLASTHPTLLGKLEALIMALKAEEQERLANSDEGEIWWAIFEAVEKLPPEETFELTGKFVGELLGHEPKNAGRSGGKRLSAMGFELHKKAKVRAWTCSEKLWEKMRLRLGYPVNVVYPWRSYGVSSDDNGVKTIKKEEEGVDVAKTAHPPHLIFDVTNATNDDNKRPLNAITQSSCKKVILLKDCPAWKDAVGQTWGPLGAGQEMELPVSEAEWAIKAGLAKPLEVG